MLVATFMAFIIILISGILQTMTISKLMAHRSQKNNRVAAGTNVTRLANPSTIGGGTNKMNNQKVSKIKASIEVKMVINSLILYILMILIAISWVLGAYGIGRDWAFDSLYLHLYSADFFNLINPLLLVLLSDTVRKMFMRFLQCQKYHI